MTSGEIINTYISAACNNGMKDGDEVCVDKGGSCGIHCSKYTTSCNIVFLEYRDQFLLKNYQQTINVYYSLNYIKI